MRIAAFLQNISLASSIRRGLDTFNAEFVSSKIELGDCESFQSEIGIKSLGDKSEVTVLITSQMNSVIEDVSVMLRYLQINSNVGLVAKDDLAGSIFRDISKNGGYQFGEISRLGIQRHLDLNGITPNSDSINLSRLRYDETLSEAFFRDLNLVFIDLSCMKYSDFKSVVSPSPSGFTSEEMCALMSQIGSSPLATIVVISGYNETKAIDEPSDINFIAQLLWYLSAGTAHRFLEDPSEESAVERIVPVELDYFDQKIEFIKSKKSGKMWLKVLSEKPKYIPLSFNEYQSISNNDWEDRWIKRVKKYL